MKVHVTGNPVAGAPEERTVEDAVIVITAQMEERDGAQGVNVVGTFNLDDITDGQMQATFYALGNSIAGTLKDRPELIMSIILGLSAKKHLGSGVHIHDEGEPDEPWQKGQMEQ